MSPAADPVVSETSAGSPRISNGASRVPLRLRVELRTPAGELFAVYASEGTVVEGGPAHGEIRAGGQRLVFDIPFPDGPAPNGYNCTAPVTCSPREYRAVVRDEQGRMVGVETYKIPPGATAVGT